MGRDTPDNPEEETEGPEIFLNGMIRVSVPQTMRIMTKLGKIQGTFIIDQPTTSFTSHSPNVWDSRSRNALHSELWSRTVSGFGVRECAVR